MTYQNTASDHFAARMPARGQTTAPAPFLTARTAFAQAWALLASFGERLMNASYGASCVRQVEALNAKSNAELAKMGIKREDIVRTVFRDVY